jgi:hypothetical protein
MSGEFYNTYFTNLSQTLTSAGVGSVVTRSKTCDFFPCAAESSIKPDDIRAERTQNVCAIKSECVSNLNVTTTGSIITDSSLNLSSLQKCVLNIDSGANPSELRQYCRGENLVNDNICTNYCNTTNCYNEINAYCNSKNREASDDIFNSANVPESTKNFCACFMNDAFYDSLKGEITSNYEFTNNNNNINNAPSYCFFNKCVNSSNKRFAERSNPSICPNEKICFNYTSVNKNGIPSEITLKEGEICKSIKKRGTTDEISPESSGQRDDTSPEETPSDDTSPEETPSDDTLPEETPWYKKPLNIILISIVIILIIVIVVNIVDIIDF